MGHNKRTIHIKLFYPEEHALCGNTRARVLNLWSDKANCKNCIRLAQKRYYGPPIGSLSQIEEAFK